MKQRRRKKRRCSLSLARARSQGSARTPERLRKRSLQVFSTNDRLEVTGTAVPHSNNSIFLFAFQRKSSRLSAIHYPHRRVRRRRETAELIRETPLISTPSYPISLRNLL